MRAEDILDALGALAPETVQAARARPAAQKPVWLRWGAMAAALALVVGLGRFALGFVGGGSGSGSAGPGSLTYMSYDGPVLPLTILSGGEELTAQREVTLDFAPYTTRTESYTDNGQTHSYTRYDTQAQVTDRYILYNATGGDILAMAAYPYVSSMDSEDLRTMTVTVNGTEIETDLHVGPYSGGFAGAWGGKEEAGSVNIDAISNWEAYLSLLEDGSYLQVALQGQTLPTDPVTVYRLDNYTYSQAEEDVNPTLEFSFTADPDKTRVLSYNINGWSCDNETGWHSLRTSGVQHRPELEPQFQHKDAAYVILVGQDIADYTLQGYRDGGCDPGEELNDLSAQVTRYETTLDQVLIEMARLYLAGGGWQLQYGRQPEQTRVEQVAELAAQLMLTHGPLAENAAERYITGALEDMYGEAWYLQRVLYRSAPVLVPAGGSAVVEVQLTKDASIDFVGKGKDREGYELVTTLGSSLTFTRQTARIQNWEQVEILAQNFGFDPAGGLTLVELDLTQPHYWIHVKKQTEP